MTTLKSNLRSLALALVAMALVGIVLFAFARDSRDAHAGGYAITCTDLTGTGTTTNGCVGTGTSTPVQFTTTTATTSLMVATGNANSVNLDLSAVASSTSSVVQFVVEYSYNGLDWYGEDSSSVSGNITTHSALNVVHTWTPGTTSSTKRSFNIQTHGAKYTRFGFHVYTANAQLYPQAIVQNAIVN